MADEVNGTANGVAIWPMKIKLRKKVIAHGDEVDELSFNEPTGADIERCGLPIIIDFANGEARPLIEPKAMAAMMSSLAAVPPSTIKMLNPQDWSVIAFSLMGLFTPAAL